MERLSLALHELGNKVRKMQDSPCTPKSSSVCRGTMAGSPLGQLHPRASVSPGVIYELKPLSGFSLLLSGLGAPLTR